MPRWLTRTCKRVRALATGGGVILSAKASTELHQLGLFLEHSDVTAVLATLSPAEFDRRMRAEDTGEWLYVFRPWVAGTELYVKFAIRGRCIVVSFHEEDEADA